MIAAPEIWILDTEWGFREGRVDEESAWEPVATCSVGLISGMRLSFWGRDSGLDTFFRDHADDLFVAHYAVAEMKYLLRLGIPLPRRWFDTFVAWRYVTNKPNNLEAGLSSALCCLGLPHLAPPVKEELREKILRLDFDMRDIIARSEIIRYCFSDCDGCDALYGVVRDRVPAAHMAHWTEYLKAVARTELRGIPIDTQSYRRVKHLQPTIKRSLIRDVNVTWPVFDGEVFKSSAFLDWCKAAGISWPVTRSKATGKLYRSRDDETLKEMEHRHPFIAQVRQVLKTLTQFGHRELVVDSVYRRHFFTTSVFRSVTGRNQPRSFIFNGPKWLRSLIVPESPEHVLVYIDFVAQEFGIAADLSKDAVMRDVYESDDCHMAFAVRAGAAPPGATKSSHPDMRKRYKTVNLGVLYGQSAHGIATRLGTSHRDAEQLLAAHRNLFPTFWNWSERMVQGAYDRHWIVSPCGWRSKVPFRSNERTWMNWPMQAAGADIMRLTVTYLDRQNVRILAPVHDGFLLSCNYEQLPGLRAAINWACASAVEHVLPGFPLRWDVTVHSDGHFKDEDGEPLWDRLQQIMESADATKTKHG